MMFSIVGWLWETPWVSFRTKKFVNRGFLRGPYIPIYGFAVVTIIFTMGIFDNVNQDNLFIILIEIIYMALVTAVWEFVTSYGLEKIFKTRWWDYSTHRFNIQGRISLGVTVFFGIGGYILYQFILPLFDELYLLFTSNQVIILLVLFYIVFMIDSVVTLIDLFKTKNIISQIERISKELSEKADIKYQDYRKQYQNSLKEFHEYVSEIRNNLKAKAELLHNNTVSEKLKTEFKNLNDRLNTSRKLNRFYKKYPNSSSYQLFQVQKTIEKIQQKVKK